MNLITRTSGRRRAGVYILLAFVIFLFLSMLFNHTMLKAEEKRYAPPGRLIEIDGHKMHIYGTGIGQPTIVMTCGSGTPSAYTDFSNILQKVSGITRTCIYERPGYGWSEQASTPRNTEQIVSDLRRLLEKAGEKPPYIFVAHSMGAMEVLLYTHKYPGEVAGIVLIDGTSPYKHMNYPGSSIPMVGIHALRAVNNLGLVRIAGELGIIPMLNKRLDSMTDEIGAIDKYMIYKNMLNDMVIREGDGLKETAEKMNGQLNFGNKPMVIFAVDKSLKELPGWQASQDSLAKMSTDSSMIVLKGSSHISALQDNTEEIANAIEEMVNKIRK